MKSFVVVSLIGIVALAFAGCASKHEKGVSSSYKSQWVNVKADTVKTTNAAKAVLEAEGLKDVTASSTNLDGTATAKKADGTVIKVSVKKIETGSDVSVSVGTLGDPKLGADLVAKIKARAEAL
jgi:hypothetical protein